MRFAWIILTAASIHLVQAQTADLIVVNARIHTVDPKSPSAAALAAKAGKIIAIGADVGSFRDPSTRVIDARGATIIPGLIDSHGHVQGLGVSLETLDLRGIASEAEIAGLVRAAAAKAAPGEWI